MASGGIQVDIERKEAYYLRLHLLLVKHGTDILRARFDHAIPPAKLHQVLQICIGTINKAKNKKFISKTQYKQLYPTQGPPKSDDFDVSLLYFLLRNICGLKSKWWNEDDNSKIPDTEQSEEADIQRIKNMRNAIQHKNIAYLEDYEFESYWDVMEKAMCRLATQCNRNDMKATLDKLKSAKLDLVSDQVRSLRVHTEYFLQEFQDENQFEETSSFEKSKVILTDKNIVILTGYPGEGKTTMAARLALSMSQPRNCLKLSNPQDWRYIDLRLKLVDTIIIDDIFGAGALDQRAVGEWSKYLPEIEKAARKKAIRVIITSRDYIFKESLDEIGSLPMFKKENATTVLLSSADLTENEKSNILKLQSMKNKKEIPEYLVRACVEASRGPTEENPGFLFGFPECASMFVRSDEMYNQGAAFFRKPSWHFKSYLEDLYRKEKDKFLALVAVWAKENKRLSLGELRSTAKASDFIKRIAAVFDHVINREFLDMLKSSLDFHVGDYLVFDETNEEYSFNHNVIGDMVGLVIGKRKPQETVEICPRDFLMKYVFIDYGLNNEFKIVVKEIHFPCLAEKCINMLLRKNCNSVENPAFDEFYELRRAGRRSNDIKVDHTIDYGIIKHNSFSSQRFVQVFIDTILAKGCVAEIFHIPVVKLVGYFFDYGISMKELTICLMGYAWFIGAFTFAKAVITSKILGNQHFDSSVSLLLATHSRQRKSIEFLLSHGAKVTGDVIYIAMHHNQPILLEMLLQRPGTDVNDRSNIVNGNYPLIVAARKGMIGSVAYLLKNGADPGVKNSASMTALHKAILYRHEAIVNLLLIAKAPLDVKGGEFKRTPLHLAADLGDLQQTQNLVRMGASLKVKDHRGHYPIFLAAIRGHVALVSFLLNIDPAQEKWRISSYGSKSVIKGMSLFHVAVWKNNPVLLNVLIELKVDTNIRDFFGQTPLFYAVMKKEEHAIEKLIVYDKTDKRKAQKQGFTPLHAAIHKGLTNIATQLAPYSDVNVTDKFGRTPLHVACETTNFAMVYCLVTEHKADVKAVTKRGDTVFHILRRKQRTCEHECKLAEEFLKENDPQFVMQLPMLKNKKGIAVRVKRPVQRMGTAYWQMQISMLNVANANHERSFARGLGESQTSAVRRTSDEDVDDDLDDKEFSDENYFCDYYDVDPYDDFDTYDDFDQYDDFNSFFKHT